MYKSFRVCRVAEYQDGNGSHCVISDDGNVDKKASCYFYTLFGRKADNTEDALIDRDTKKELTGLLCRLNSHDALVDLLEDILEWDGILPHSKTRIREALKQAKEASNDR